jgi:hypothetical protein
MSRSYTSSPSCSSIGVMWDCFTYILRLIVRPIGGALEPKRRKGARQQMRRLAEPATRVTCILGSECWPSVLNDAFHILPVLPGKY